MSRFLIDSYYLLRLSTNCFFYDHKPLFFTIPIPSLCLLENPTYKITHPFRKPVDHFLCSLITHRSIKLAVPRLDTHLTGKPSWTASPFSIVADPALSADELIIKCAFILS